jgi:hypothetical protein
MNVQPDLRLIETVSAELSEMLGEDFDPETFWDSLDGETDALDILDHLLASMQDDDALATAAKEQAFDISSRARRIADRAAAKKKALGLILDAAGQKKVERPRGTVSRLAGRLSVQITDETSVPSQLCKTTVAPDKTAIKKQLEAGEAVPGAELVRGPDTVSVRVK